jgi:preprotein translocase subunit YajC
MIQPETTEKKKGLSDRAPRIGRLSQLILLIVVFIIIVAALWFINNKQSERQAELKSTLASLDRILTVEQTPKAKLEAELAQVTAETEATKAVFPSFNQSPAILDSLLKLVELNDIYVTQTKISTFKSENAIGPTLTVELKLRGQVPKFQNFLLALDSEFPTSKIKNVYFTIAGPEGEEDNATITIDILCYEGQ